MNLITNPWLPVRRQIGRDHIAPHQIADTDNPVLALDAPRPDFNGALLQFLIGLLQTVCAPRDPIRWRAVLKAPPADLEARFAALAPAFELDGDGPRFMQDLDRHLQGSEVDIAGLLIDVAGGGTASHNTDHFIKRDQIGGLCEGCAAMALLTLMTNAPSGGKGHRTSLRGGGPLTTLVCFDPRAAPDSRPVTLWQDLWLNVLDQSTFLGSHDPGGPEDWFPWLSPTRTSEKNQRVTPANGHPALLFWATPRRIVLDWEHTAAGTCDLCGQPSERLARRYLTRHHGANYTDWLHPLSPHYRQKTETEWLPVHPQPGGFTYRHWPEWALAEADPLRAPARVVVAFSRLNRSDAFWDAQPERRIRAFGYDMDNMKTRCWYEGEYPLYAIADATRRRLFAEEAAHWVAVADTVRGYGVEALKEAWSDRPKDLKGDVSFIDLAFWDATEGDFYRLLHALADLPLEQETDADLPQQPLREDWRRRLEKAALELFGRWAESGQWEYENPGRIAAARNKLMGRLRGPALKKALGLPVTATQQSRSKS